MRKYGKYQHKRFISHFLIEMWFWRILTNVSLGATLKRRQIFFVRFWYPPPPCRNFDPDLPSNIFQHRNLRPPTPLDYSDIFYGWPPGHLWLLLPKRDILKIRDRQLLLNTTVQRSWLAGKSDEWWQFFKGNGLRDWHIRNLQANEESFGKFKITNLLSKPIILCIPDKWIDIHENWRIGKLFKAN